MARTASVLFVAVVAMIVGVVLFAVNRRAQSSHEQEAPRAPSQPAVDPASVMSLTMVIPMPVENARPPCG